MRVFTVSGLINNWTSLSQFNLNKYDIILPNEIWQVKEFENINLEKQERRKLRNN